MVQLMANIQTHIDYATSPMDNGVPILHRVNTPAGLESALVLSRGKHGAILVERVNEPWNFHTYEDVWGAGNEPDELLYITGDVDNFTELDLANSESEGIILSKASGISVSNFVVEGTHSPDAIHHGKNRSGLGVSAGFWMQENGRWVQRGWRGGGYTQFIENIVRNNGTGIVGWGSAGFLIARVDAFDNAAYGKEGLSGISMVRMFGNETNPGNYDQSMPFDIRTPDGDPVLYAVVECVSNGNRQLVDSTGIGEEEPTDGNGLIIGNAENAPGAVLVDRLSASLNSSSGLGLYEIPRGGAIVQNSLLEGNQQNFLPRNEDIKFARRHGKSYHPERADWGGELLAQNNDHQGQRNIWTFNLDLQVDSGISSPAQRLRNVTETKMLQEVFIDAGPDEGPDPDPEPDPEPVTDYEERIKLLETAVAALLDKDEELAEAIIRAQARMDDATVSLKL